MTEFRVLGPVQAVADGVSLPLGGPKQRAVLAELLLHGGGVVTHARLVDAVWGDEPPDSAKTSLQVYVHGLRRAVGAERIETLGDGYRLHFEPEELDLARFERLVGDAERALGDERPAEAAEDLATAVGLWQGPPLSDLADQPVARTAVPRLEELRLRAVELRNEARLALGEHDALVPELEALVAAEPFRERLREQLILALYRAGRQKEALEAYQDARSMLVEELGVDPGPALQELERAILRQDESLLATPVARQRQLRLPTASTALIGRKLEVAAVEALLRREEGRLVTLTGVGGTGKTRLALAVAQELGRELADGAAFVDLSTVRSGELVLPAVAHALSLADSEDPLDALRDRSLLLVLDNLEQIDDAAAPVVALLGAGPRLRILATSRVPLRIAAERQYAVPPLESPDEGGSFEELVANDAVRLFASRAQSVEPEFALTDANVAHVASVCRRLDGLPLAIELAAARSSVLPPAAIESRLTRALELLVAGARDLPERQQTLRATLDWSYDLLTLGERRLLAEVSVFAGGWTLADADAVVGRDTSLDLEGLIASNLVRRRGSLDAPRFFLLETIRVYASEKLDDPAELRRQHALHFAALADEASAGIQTGGETEVAGYELLEREHDNLRAAVAWASETGDVELESRLATAMRWFWLVRGYLREGDRIFSGLRERTAPDSELHAHVLVLGAAFPWRLGDTDEAKRQWETALRLYRELGDHANIARCIAELGTVAVSEEDMDRASELFEESALLFEEHGNLTRLATVLANLAAIAARRHDTSRALEYGERAIAIQRETDDHDGLAVTLANTARVRLATGDDAGARTDLHESISIGREIGYHMLLAYTLGAVAELVVRTGAAEHAARLLGAAESAFRSIGMSVPAEEAEEHERTLVAIREAIDQEHLEALVREGTAAPFEIVVAEAHELTR